MVKANEKTREAVKNECKSFKIISLIFCGRLCKVLENDPSTEQTSGKVKFLYPVSHIHWTK